VTGIRRTVGAALVVALAGLVTVAAAERGTFVLRNGQRETGVLVFHGGEQANLILGYFNLGGMQGGTGQAKERAYKQADVAIIDIAGGQPAPQELSQLNRMNGKPNLLVLRGGRSILGRFENVVRGDTVVFDGQTYPVRDVARVYLDIAAAKQIFRVQPDPPAQTDRRDDRDAGRAVGRDRDPGRGRDDGDEGRGGPGVSVSARRRWTDSGFAVRAGQRVEFKASGRIWISDNEACDADGLSTRRRSNPNFPVPSAPPGTLIGRVGNGPAFEIGLDTRPITMREDGVLYLGVNDDMTDDNRGSFRVEVSIIGRR
jgi:hypothetical protein